MTEHEHREKMDRATKAVWAFNRALESLTDDDLDELRATMQRTGILGPGFTPTEWFAASTLRRFQLQYRVLDFVKESRKRWRQWKEYADGTRRTLPL